MPKHDRDYYRHDNVNEEINVADVNLEDEIMMLVESSSRHFNVSLFARAK